MMQRKGETGDAGPKEMAEALTPEERLLERKVRAANRRCSSRSFGRASGCPYRLPGFSFSCRFSRCGSSCRRASISACSALSARPSSFPSCRCCFSRRPDARGIARAARAAPPRSTTGRSPRSTTRFCRRTLLPKRLALWEAHRARAAQALKRSESRGAAPAHRQIRSLRTSRRASAFARRRPAAGHGAILRSRLQAAFTVPEIPAGAGFRIDAWISPPPYTRKEPFVLPDAASKGKERHRRAAGLAC